MAGRRETSRTQQPTQAAPSYPSQRGQFVLEAEGIDRDVITTDICRYLGNDALVRPGKVVDPETGKSTDVYFITAYRNLTSYMIHDLKVDSAQWKAESAQRLNNAAYPSNDVNYRSSMALGQSIARMDNAAQPRPQGGAQYASPSQGASSSSQYQPPSGQPYPPYAQSSGYAQSSSYSQPVSSTQYSTPPQTGYPSDSRNYVHGAAYSVDQQSQSAGRGSIPQATVPRAGAVQYAPSTNYPQTTQYSYSTAGTAGTTPAYSTNYPTDASYGRAPVSGSYDSAPEYDNQAYGTEPRDYQETTQYPQEAPYGETGYAQPAPSSRSATGASSSSRRGDRDSRDERDRHRRHR